MSEKKITKSIRFEKGMMEKLDKRSKEENRSFNNLVETIVIKDMKNYSLKSNHT